MQPLTQAEIDELLLRAPDYAPKAGDRHEQLMALVMLQQGALTAEQIGAVPSSYLTLGKRIGINPPQFAIADNGRNIVPTDTYARWQGSAAQIGTTWIVGYKRADDLNGTNSVLRMIKSTDYGVTWSDEALPAGVTAPTMPLTGTQAVQVEAVDLFVIDGTVYCILEWQNGREGGSPTNGLYTEVLSRLYTVNPITLEFTLVSTIDERVDPATESVQVTSRPVKMGSNWFMAASFWHVATPGAAGASYKTAVLESTDSGSTWTRVNVYTGATQYVEPQLLLDDGVLELWSRSGGYPGAFTRWSSLDGATWSPLTALETPSEFGSNYSFPLRLNGQGGRIIATRLMTNAHAVWVKASSFRPIFPFSRVGPSGNTNESGYGADIWEHNGMWYVLHFTGSPYAAVCLSKLVPTWSERFDGDSYFRNTYSAGLIGTNGSIGEGGLASSGANSTTAFLGPRESSPNGISVTVADSTVGSRYYYSGSMDARPGAILGAFEANVSLVTSLSGKRVFYGVTAFAAPNSATVGQKYLEGDPATNPNWILKHVSDAGVVTSQDTGCPILTGWNRLRLYFGQGYTVASVNDRTPVMLANPPTTTNTRGVILSMDTTNSTLGATKVFYVGEITYSRA